MFKSSNLTIDKFHFKADLISIGKSLTVRKCNIRFAVNAGMRVKAWDLFLIHRIAGNITFGINLFENLFASDELRNSGKGHFAANT